MCRGVHLGHHSLTTNDCTWVTGGTHTPVLVTGGDDLMLLVHDVRPHVSRTSAPVVSGSEGTAAALHLHGHLSTIRTVASCGGYDRESSIVFTAGGREALLAWRVVGVAGVGGVDVQCVASAVREGSGIDQRLLCVHAAVIPVPGEGGGVDGDGDCDGGARKVVLVAVGSTEGVVTLFVLPRSCDQLVLVGDVVVACEKPVLSVAIVNAPLRGTYRRFGCVLRPLSIAVSHIHFLMSISLAKRPPPLLWGRLRGAVSFCRSLFLACFSSVAACWWPCRQHPAAVRPGWLQRRLLGYPGCKRLSHRRRGHLPRRCRRRHCNR